MLSLVLGTRPEIITFSPIIRECEQPGRQLIRLCSRRFRAGERMGGLGTCLADLPSSHGIPKNGPFLYAVLPIIDQEHRVMPPQVPAHRQRNGKSPVFVARLEKALPALKAKYGVKRIGIFGSCARGDETRTSDVDVLVEFAPGQATFDNFMPLVYDLEALFKRKVDLLTVAGVDKYIRSQVEHEVIWIEG